MRHTMTLTALTASLLVSTAAYAVDNSAKASIKSLPESGSVSLQGTVDRVVDGDTFILRDGAGETIDVHTNAELSVKKGDTVSVKGEKTAEIAGMGKEIKNATVSVRSAAAGETTTNRDMTNNRMSNSTAATTARANEDTPKAVRDNTEDKKTAAYDLDVDVDRDGDQVRAAADVEKVADSGEMTAAEASRISAANAEATPDRTNRVAEGTTNNRSLDRTVEGVTGTATGAVAGVASSIDALPKEGSVTLSGTVDRVSSDEKFILRDAQGKTIDVHTASQVNVKPGDIVRIDGNVKSELLGFGRQIEGATVRVSSAN